ncbi:MAG: hypothetical protein JWM97_1272 [Phycisphaerales bacterium]|jgi:uncharacterized protein YwqG|nr:hypothetical protein [Phycisphaerales bacterium]
MTDQEFRRHCDLHGFGDVASTIRQYALPCIGFSLRADAATDANRSKLGGILTAPKSFEWPKYKGRPLDFLLQVNLSDVDRHNSTGLLPSKGLMTFFYELEEQPWGYDPKNLSFFKVCYFTDGVELFDTPRPEHRLNSPSLPEKGIDFWPAFSLPTHGSRAWGRLSKQIKTPGSDFDFSAFDQLSQAVFRAAAPTPEGPRHKLGGHSDNIQNDMQLEAQLVMNGLYCGDASGYRDPRRPDLERACEEWRLLLQLDSDETAKLMWGDLGMLYFWVRQSDLSRGDLSSAWMTLQCG